MDNYRNAIEDVEFAISEQHEPGVIEEIEEDLHGLIRIAEEARGINRTQADRALDTLREVALYHLSRGRHEEIYTLVDQIWNAYDQIMTDLNTAELQTKQQNT